MRSSLTRKEWHRFRCAVAHLINHPSFWRCCSREIAEHALIAVVGEAEVSVELLDGANYDVSYRRAVRRRRLHRERAARLRRRVVSARP